MFVNDTMSRGAQLRKFKGGKLVSFSPVLTLQHSRHIAGHGCRWVIVPLHLVQSFGVICTHNRYFVIHHAIFNLRPWFSPCGKGNSRLLGGLGYMKQSGGTLTLLHTWRQDGCRNRFFPLNLLLIAHSATQSVKWVWRLMSHKLRIAVLHIWKNMK